MTTTAANLGWVGARRLLRQLRDIMAGPGSAQEQLDLIVTLIARELVAEVCSIYLRRAGDALELFATEGLRPDAVHNTRLMVGEGLGRFRGSTGHARGACRRAETSSLRLSSRNR